MRPPGSVGRRLHRAAALAVLAAGTAGFESSAREAELDPVGVWSCLMYGASGNLRFYLGLAENGGARMARPAEADDGQWRALGEWRRLRDRLEFDDVRNGRLFTASLGRQDLGGTWLGVRDRGGWWCAARGLALGDEPPAAGGLLEALVPAIMASPNYPRSAIRDAKEGRTVSCFIVTGAGEIRRPEVVETTDDVFREPTLEAVVRSRYRSWGDDDATLPACRSFTFELGTDG